VLQGAELVIAGSERADVELVRPILERLGELRYVGPFGSGARLKLVANGMLGALVVLAAELETAGAAAGLAPETIFDVLTRSVPALAVRRAGYIDDRHEPTLFALRDLRKDLDLALGVFHRVDAHVPMTALVREWVDEAAAVDGGLDISAIVRRYTRTPGVGSTVGVPSRAASALHPANWMGGPAELVGATKRPLKFYPAFELPIDGLLVCEARKDVPVGRSFPSPIPLTAGGTHAPRSQSRRRGYTSPSSRCLHDLTTCSPA
jgi:hypothetical protein